MQAGKGNRVLRKSPPSLTAALGGKAGARGQSRTPALGYWTVSVTVAEWLVDPDCPVIVSVLVPVGVPPVVWLLLL